MRRVVALLLGCVVAVPVRLSTRRRQMTKMFARRTARAAAVLILTLLPLPAHAQPVARTFEAALGKLEPGDTVWVTDATKREVKRQVVDLAPSGLILSTNKGHQEVPVRDIMRLRRRYSDPVANGALIGAAVALVPLVVWFAPMTESGETAGESMGFIALMVAGGAGAGAGIDALVHGRQTIYVAPPSASTGAHVSPILSRNAAGVRVSLSF